MTHDVDRFVRRAARVLPPIVADPVRKRRDAYRRARDLALILRSRVFDQEWYEAQTGSSFPGLEAACRHYLLSGRWAGMSPHPLFEPSFADPARRSRATPDAFVRNLRGQRLSGPSVHPLVPVQWSAPRSVGGLPEWAVWAAKADATTRLPNPDGRGSSSLKWGPFRLRALEIARAQRRARSVISAPRLLDALPDLETLADVTMPVREEGGPLVSIIMPAWNRAPVLRRAVESAQCQTLDDWELIIVDDGSEDDTLPVLEGMSARDPRIRVIPVAHGGVCRARNVGLAQARGRFVAFLDTDNTWTPTFLRTAVGFLLSENVRWAHAVMEIETDAGARYRALGGDREHLLVSNYIDLNVLVARTQPRRRSGRLRRIVATGCGLRPRAAVEPGGATRLVPTVGAVYTDKRLDTARISVSEPLSWNLVVQSRHLINAQVESRKPTTPGRVSVVIPVRQRVELVVELVDELRASDGDIEIVLVVSGARDAFVRMMQMCVMTRPNVVVVMWPADLQVSGSANFGAAHASGEYLAIWGANHRPFDGWRSTLVEALQAPGVAVVQPLALQVDGRVSSAGAVFVGSDPSPTPFLSGFPVEDALPLRVMPIPAALGAPILVSADVYWRLGGMDALYGNGFGEVDLSLRAREGGHGETLLVTSSTVTTRAPSRFGYPVDPSASVRVLRRAHRAPRGSSDAWKRAGFEIIGRRVSELRALPNTEKEQGAVPVVRPVLTQVEESAPRLRWALDIAAPSGPRGLRWGDWHFAQSLAAALRDHGQHVHVDRRDARNGSHRNYDDITLVLRGLDLVVPTPGGVSLMWVISHPELLSAAECATYDAVFAASTTWSHSISKQWRVPITPLLQCTDATLFQPNAAEADSGDDVIFVGNSRKVLRPAVQYALSAGLEPVVYGGEWKGLIADDHVRAEFVPNREVPALYAGAGVVLNDHWEDMRVDGFISNRTFDVLACAGRLLSDDVAGLSDLFGPAVEVFQSQHDVARLLTGDWRAKFPDRKSRLRTAQHIRSEHSFDARATTLLDAAVQALKAAETA